MPSVVKGWFVTVLLTVQEILSAVFIAGMISKNHLQSAGDDIGENVAYARAVVTGTSNMQKTPARLPRPFR